MRPIVCVDVDGVLALPVEHPRIESIGEPIPGAKAFLDHIHKTHDIVIHSCRTTAGFSGRMAPNLLAKWLRDWLDKNEFIYDHIWIGEGKPIADGYVDDRGIRCKPIREDGRIEAGAFRIAAGLLGSPMPDEDKVESVPHE